MPLRGTSPPLYSLSRGYWEWLSGFERVFSREPYWPGTRDYYLEGSIRNYDTEVFALPLAMQALRQGQYFVGESDGKGLLDTLCRSLRHRGVECMPDAQEAVGKLAHPTRINNSVTVTATATRLAQRGLNWCRR